MIKENCKCGANFEVTSGDKDWQAYRYSEFLHAHRVCRGNANPPQSDTEQKCPDCGGDGQISWQNGPDDRIGQVDECEVCNGTGKADKERKA